MAASTALQVLVSPLLGTVFDSLRSLIESEFALISGVNEEFERLSEILSTIHDVIEDAEVKQLTEKPINNWLRKLKDVACDVEDFLDECASDAASGLRLPSVSLEPSGRFNNIQEFLTGSVPSLLGIEPSSSSRRTIAERIDEFINKFDAIAEQRHKFHLIPYVAVGSPQSGQQLRETTSYIADSRVYGRDQDKEYIVNQLLKNISMDRDDHQARDVFVCPIVGLGGLGKTTLAQMIYQDEMIAKLYEIRSWVCVSENFDPKTLFKAIIESCGEAAHDLRNLEPVQSRLGKILDDKRFLIVLDDVWNEDQAKWETLKSSLSCGSRGSSIIVTTRLATVASIMSTIPPYYPGTLSEDDCWSLFKQRAFSSSDIETACPKLEKIGRQIVKKCGGIPLAAKALGGLLRFKRDEKQWLFVQNSEIWELPQNTSDAIFPALRLSYNHLSSNAKQYFSFCSIFLKDDDIVKEELINLWMANGFLRSKGGMMEPEDIGNEIFNELLLRSFFQDLKTDDENQTTKCRMHDLVHDLACSTMSGDDCSAFVEEEWVDHDKEEDVTGRASSTTYFSRPYGSVLSKTPSRMRTLVRLANYFGRSTSSLEFIFSNLKCLRVLDLREMDISTLPDSIGNLKHLRYLNLSSTKITLLPNEYLCCLTNLQILDLSACSELTHLPPDLRKLTNLRHFCIEKCKKLTEMPKEMGNLSFLRTLSLFIVGKETSCGIAQLQGLNHLKGELVITRLGNVENSTDARKSNLIRKQHLESLKLCWSASASAATEEEVAEALQPHSNIKQLNIRGYGGAKLPHWIGAGVSLCLPNLVRLTLFDCYECEYLPPLGELPLLKFLEIGPMDSVKCISKEFYHSQDNQPHTDQITYFFPSLETLHIYDMPNLEAFSSPPSYSDLSWGSPSNQLVSAYPCLRTLRIRGCPKLKSYISLPYSVERLDIMYNHEMGVLRSLEKLPSCLSHLQIGGFPDLLSFPVAEEEEEEEDFKHSSLTQSVNSPVSTRKHSNLANLEMVNFFKLKTLPKEFFQHHTSLTLVRIFGCCELSHLEGMQNLISLKELWIHNCDGLKSLNGGLRYLTNLELLDICNCHQLNFCPGDFQYLISLKSLSLRQLPKIAYLPSLVIGGIGSSSQQPITAASPTLKTMHISSCENLKSLSDGALQWLTALRFLYISDCHLDLHRRCQKNSGEYWPRIAHVKYCFVDCVKEQ